MTKKFITKEHEYYRTNGALRSMLQDTVAGHNAQYALEYVLVEPDKLVATDGKKMVVIRIKHDVPPGLYYITEDGFLLKTDDNDRYPKYRSILLDDAEVKVITTIPYKSKLEVAFGSIVAHLNREGMIFDVIALLGVLLPGISDQYCKVKTISPEHPFQIEFNLDDKACVTYIQMPVKIPVTE